MDRRLASTHKHTHSRRTQRDGGRNEVEAKAMISKGSKPDNVGEIYSRHGWVRCWHGILSLSGQRAGVEYRRFVQGKGVGSVSVECGAFQ